jgi:hypothetical protein
MAERFGKFNLRKTGILNTTICYSRNICLSAVDAGGAKRSKRAIFQRRQPSAPINFTHGAETFFWSHPLDCSTSRLGTAHVQLAKGGRIRSIHGFRVIWQGSKNYKTEGLRQKKRSHEDK